MDLKKHIRSIPDYPKKGILFRDITTLIKDAKAFKFTNDKIIEISKKNGDPNRFSCDIYIEGLKESSAFGKSHKQAETNAARVLIEKFINIGKI